MSVISDLLASVSESDCTVRQVVVGALLTAVVLEEGDRQWCGLASTLRARYHPRMDPAVEGAGQLTRLSARRLAALACSASATEASTGMAAINALCLRQDGARPSFSNLPAETNAEELIIRHAGGRNVALVGHFPFVERLRPKLANLWVLEQQPCPEDLPAEAAPDIIPRSDLIALTSMTLPNGTFEPLAALVRPGADLMVLGPGTPLSPVLFRYGVRFLAGCVVENIPQVVRAVIEGANFRQARKQGVRLATLEAPA
jgi:uncharacterized protein